MKTNISTPKTMRKAFLATLLFAGGLTGQTFAAADAFGTGSYQAIQSCTCSGPDQAKVGTVSFSFNFIVNGTGPCGDAAGTFTLADSGCKVRLKGRITKVASFTVDEFTGDGVAIVYGVVTSGKLKGEFFKLEISGGQFSQVGTFAFKIVTNLCGDDCPGYIASGILPGGTFFFGL